MDRSVFARGLAGISRGLIAAVFPLACPACGAGLAESVAGLPLCAACAAGLVDCGPRFCLSCAQAGGSPRACRRGDHLALRAGFTWTEPLRALVHAFKFGGAEELAGALVEAAWHGPGFHPAPAPDVIAAVPLHGLRRRERGYDQAEALATGFAARAQAPLVRALVRVRATRQQARLPAAARRANAAEAFAVAVPGLVVGKRVALVDDVVTTGATMDVAARAVRAAGARSVEAWCIAYEPLE